MNWRNVLRVLGDFVSSHYTQCVSHHQCDLWGCGDTGNTIGQTHRMETLYFTMLFFWCNCRVPLEICPCIKACSIFFFYPIIIYTFGDYMHSVLAGLCVTLRKLIYHLE
uniref:Uncharacterized protein n=1 Tax=Pyxicephalus adspersus TaxID=30357 RepID=A0AAV3APJ6_PYXAD|nr:TPA: hypothetical protein GDO54_006916 [Pyxicephalus adspersus]